MKTFKSTILYIILYLNMPINLLNPFFNQSIIFAKNFNFPAYHF